MAGHTSVGVSGKSHIEASVVNIVGGQVTKLPDGGRSGQWMMRALLLGRARKVVILSSIPSFFSGMHLLSVYWGKPS